jgi:phage replication O-like protein O
MSIQIDDGDFTRIHNEILEKLALARFTASEYRCLMFLLRMTYGWQKKEDAISLSQWAKGTGIDPEKRHNVLRTLQALVAKRVICTKSHGNNHAATWAFNKHFEEWDASLFQETVISHDNTSVIKQDNIYKATVISADNTSVISRDNKTVISRDNHKRKKETLKKVKSAPKAAPHPAVVIFHEVWKRNPNAPQAKSISERVTDCELWREACQAWGDKGHRSTNVDGMLDWYDHPERFRTAYRPPPNGGDYAGRSTNNGVNAVMDYVKAKGLFNERD